MKPSFRYQPTPPRPATRAASPTASVSDSDVDRRNVLTVLTSREHEVFRLVMRGMTSKEVGSALFVSPRTVDFHITNIYVKFGVNSRSQAFREAFRRGLLD